MITPTKAFQTSDGQTFADIEGAQGQELKLLLTPCGDCSAAISILVVQREKVIDILSTTATSKPRARNQRRTEEAQSRQQRAASGHNYVMRSNPLFIAVAALKKIQYTYTGDGQSYEDLCQVKTLAEQALKRLKLWEISLSEFETRAKAQAASDRAAAVNRELQDQKQ